MKTEDLLLYEAMYAEMRAALGTRWLAFEFPRRRRARAAGAPESAWRVADTNEGGTAGASSHPQRRAACDESKATPVSS